MLHNNIDSIVSQLMFSNGELLKSNVVQEHLSKVNSHRLALGLVHGIVDIQLLKGIVALVQHRQYSNDPIVVDLVVAKVEREQLVVGEQQLSHHHRPICLNFVPAEVEELQAQAFFE